MRQNTRNREIAWLAATILAFGVGIGAAGWPHWGGTPGRNMVSSETNVPTEFDPGQEGPDSAAADPDGELLWSARLGTQCYGSPVASDGLVFVGTNNGHARIPQRLGDRGVLMCLQASTGRLAWELTVPKIAKRKYFNGDRPGLGICSSPTIDGDRVYVVTNRCEVLCLDIHGLYDGNAGPFRAESQYLAVPLVHRVHPGKSGPAVEFRPGLPVPLTVADADIIWRFDMIAGVGSWPQDAANSSPLVVGNLLFVGTSTGICDDRTRHALYPHTPSLIVLDKRNGRLLAVDHESIGGRAWHGQWSSPSFGVVNGRPLVFYGGGDGVCYAFDARVPPGRGTRPGILRTVWRYDCNPLELKMANGKPIRYKTPGDGPSEIIATPVFDHGRVYVAVGQDPTHGPGKGCLSCIDASDGHQIWSYTGLGRSISTVAVLNGRVYAADYEGNLHCLAADTGKPLWVFDAQGHVWGSPLVADGKIYLGTARGDLWVLAAAGTEHVLAHLRLPKAVYSTPIIADGTLYIACQDRLYAVRSPNPRPVDEHQVLSDTSCFARSANVP
jgi:outer membrane protein assembly factor BamB